MHGNGLLDIIPDILSEVVTGIFKDVLMNAIEGTIKNVLQQTVDDIDLGGIINPEG